MAFVKMSDETMQAEAVLFPDVFREVQPWIREEILVLVHGKSEERSGKLQWQVTDIFPLEEQRLSELPDERLFIQVLEKENDQALNQIKQAAANHPGSVPVILHHASTKKTYQLSSEYWINGSKASIVEIKRLFGEENVVFKKNGRKG